MQSFEHALDLLFQSIFAFLLALVGGFVRYLHERAHGAQHSWPRIALVLLSAILMGVIGQTAGDFLTASYNFPVMTSGALGGLLGYLGPTVLDTATEIGLTRLKGGSKEDDKSDEKKKAP